MYSLVEKESDFNQTYRGSPLYMSKRISSCLSRMVAEYGLGKVIRKIGQPYRENRA